MLERLQCGNDWAESQWDWAVVERAAALVADLLGGSESCSERASLVHERHSRAASIFPRALGAHRGDDGQSEN